MRDHLARNGIAVLLPDLTFMDLQQCPKLNDTELENIVRAARHLEIVNYYGELLSHKTEGGNKPLIKDGID